MTSTADVAQKVEAKESQTRANTLHYPMKVSTKDLPHITMIELYKYDKADFDSIEKREKQGSIILPIASNINYSDMQEWEEFDGGAIAAGVNAVYNGDDYLGAVKRFGTGLVKNVVESIGKGSADSSFNTIQSMSGISINPMRANVYRAPKFREFQLEYTLVAKTPEESLRIKKIENVLRYYSTPARTSTSGGFLQAPSVFQISHWSSDGSGTRYSPNNYLPKYLPAALVAIGVDYNSNGDNYLHAGTFAPIDVKITLAFKELEYDTKFRQENRLGLTESNMWE